MKGSEQPIVQITEPQNQYRLIDSGDGEKLEKYGDFIVSRPDPQALWPKTLPESEWHKAQAVFSRSSEKAGWKLQDGVPERWSIEFGGLTLWIRPTSFKHTGLFPEQLENWQWLQKVIRAQNTTEPVRILNLFGYTGGASLACAAAGAEVTHVDGSKSATTWAKENAERSNLQDKPIRWILDDARTFVGREIKRGKTYHGIIMDPPAFGHGPEGEVWKIEDNFLQLIEDCKKILDPQAILVLLNGYAAGYSAFSYEYNLRNLVGDRSGVIERGELTIRESTSGRLLPSGIYARWSK